MYNISRKKIESKSDTSYHIRAKKTFNSACLIITDDDDDDNDENEKFRLRQTECWEN